MQPEFLNLGERALQTLESWQSAFAAIGAVGVGPEQTSANTPGVTIAEVSARVTASLAALSRLKGAESERLDLIAQRLPQLKAALDVLDAQSQSIQTTLGQWQGATATDRNGHLNIQINQPERGTTNYDLGSPLLIVTQQAAILLDALPYIAQVLGDESISVFTKIVRASEEQLVQARAAAEGAKKQLTAGTTAVAELTLLGEQASQLGKQVQEVLTSITSQKGTVETNSAEVLQKLVQVREVSKDADTLQQKVTGFASQFEAFEGQMKARLQQFSEFEIATGEGQRLNEDRERKIQELMDKADTMIRGATTAGLSKSLEDTKDFYETRLAETQKYFLWSVVALLVSALPIAAQIVPGPWQPYFAPTLSTATTGATPWLAAIGKLILVIPGTWATAFFANNYAELFHLSREYAHKAALAKAIDGFKREAPEYAQEIVGSVFMEIQDNPGSRKAPPPATPQNPVTQKFLEKVLVGIKAAKS